MKREYRHWVASVLVVLSLSVGAQEDIPGPAIGEQFSHSLNAPDQNGQTRKLVDLMGEKGMVLFFVRSADWCPYCQRQLADVNTRFSEFAALGLSVVSVSVDDVAEIAKFADAQEIEFTMLADPLGAINDALGIRDPQYPVGSAAFGVPRPVLYVLDRDGVIRLRYMEPTYRTRPDLDAVLRDARALGL